MPYFLRTDVVGRIPPQYLTDALDDDEDGQEDAGLFDNLVATVSNDVDGYLAGIFTTPFFDPAPAQVKAAALVLFFEALYDRRPVGDNNPWRARANEWRSRLQRIGKRELPLDAGESGKVAAPARTGSNHRVKTRQEAIHTERSVDGNPPVPGPPGDGDWDGHDDDN